jgi:hypothetical protein
MSAAMRTTTTRPLRLAAASAVALLLCAASPARAQDVAISESARTHFAAGVRLLQDPGGARYEEAYQEFRVAYADSPSPRILGNVGLCAMKLERDEEAIRAFEKYLAAAPKIDPAERKQIESDLGTLRASLARVTLAVTTSDVRVVDVRTPVQGTSVTNVYGPFPAGSIQLGIHPGHHIITVKRDGYVSSTWELDAVPGGSASHPFALQKIGDDRPATAPVVPPPTGPIVTPPAPPPGDALPRPTPASVWAMTGVTVALGLAGAITGSVAVAKHDDYNSINDGTRIPDAQSLHDTGQRLNIATDVLLGTAVVGAVVTIVLYATRPSVKPAAAKAGTPKVGASVGGGVRAFATGWSF